MALLQYCFKFDPLGFIQNHSFLKTKPSVLRISVVTSDSSLNEFGHQVIVEPGIHEIVDAKMLCIWQLLARPLC